MKKKKIVLFVFLMMGVLSVVFIYKFKQNNLSKNKPIKEEKLSIMIKEDGAADYTKSSSKEIPKGDYVLNAEKTHCENNGQVTSYDNATGTVSFSFIGSDKCYLYFDYKSSKLFSEVVKVSSNLVSSQDGTSFEIDDENGIRYEGANPDNFICLDNQKEGACADNSLLFRIIGLFDEEYSIDGTNSSGTKSLLKIIDTNNYGGDNGKVWNSDYIPDWSTASLKTELNGTYLITLINLSNLNSKLSSAIVNVKWHLGDPSNNSATVDDIYTQERNTSAVYSGNPESIYAKVGLLYPSDYGYASVDDGMMMIKASCRTEINNYICIESNWLFTSQSSFVNDGEWLLSPYSSYSSDSELLINSRAAYLTSSGYLELYGDKIQSRKHSVRPTFYLDSETLKIVGGDGSSSNPYHIG